MILRDISSVFRSRPIIIFIATAVLVVAIVWVIITALRPFPPRTVTMATGPEGEIYYEIGKRYRDLLGKEGIEVRLLPTAGSLENLAKLNDPKSGVKVGFLQAGFTNAKEMPNLESLGTVFYEPLWFFYRSVYQGEAARGHGALKGRKISVGPEGSGTRRLALELLARNGIDQNSAQLFPLVPHEAAEQLLADKIDAAFMLTSWESPAVQRLLSDENIEVFSFSRADAYVALYPFLNKVVVPAGVADLAKNRPPADTVLFALKASLVVRQDLHPAIQYLLLDAAEEIHSKPGIFHKAGHFPSAEAIDLPLSDEAQDFYKSGRPFLQRHLPFWMAALIGRLLIVLIPVVGVIYPLFQAMPALYGWEMQRRIYQLYGELRFLEKDLESRPAGTGIDDLTVRLNRLEEKANRLRVSVSYASMVYTLRAHIALVHQRLKKME